MFEESLELMSGFSMELTMFTLMIIVIIMMWVSISKDSD